MKKTATALAILASLGAASADAQVVVGPNDLQGSDTLFNVIRDLNTRLGINPANLTYVGGGSGTGITGMRTSNRQEIAPSSRFFSTAECTDPARPASAKAYAIAGDAIVNVAGSLGPACANLNWGTTIAAQDLNGTAGIQGAASTDLADWKTIMRIVYLGRIADTATTSDCDADIRHTIIKNWGNVFKDGCASGTCTTGLKHAFRRDDVSGTTDTFLELLGVGSSQRFTAVPAPTVSPFCNGFDNQDNDPVRVTCTGTGFNGTGDEVCGLGSTTTATNPRNNTLGVVLPTLVPQENAYGQASTPAPGAGNCGTTPIGGAIFGNVAWTLADVQRYGARCPNGVTASGGVCKWPKKAGSGAGAGFGCVAGKGDKPAGSPGAFDARAYNLWLRTGDGTVLSYQRNGSQIRENVGYYRIHQVGSCAFPDASDQIGCFVAKDTCSIGFSGLGVLERPNTKALGIRSKVADGAGGVFESVVPPALTDADRVAKLNRYGLSRNLYVTTWDEFANVGAQTADFVTAQQQILGAVTSGSPDVAAAVSAAGFYTLPTPYAAEVCP
jgi:ABC-type phosphate transport system substrate-binding protein